MVKDKTPISLISEVIDHLKNAKLFNKFDIIWGYNNICIKKGDKWKKNRTASGFVTKNGIEHLVHWKEYGNEEDQWLPKSHLSNMEEAIQEYHDRFSE
ncbi:hypothetical protein AN958_03272 [Leucoagaricus sp. SymC.cos]|nr:hypothetical protein AN958_03272 [Leucoagaricus sp. SymC.cos]